MARSSVDQGIEEGVEAFALGLGRFLTGRELDGVRRTNATFLRKGTRVMDQVEGRVGRWSYLPYWKRFGVRMMGSGALGLGVFEYLKDPRLTLQVLEFGGVGAAGLATVSGVVHGVRNRGQAELMREWVTPLHLSLVGPLGLSEHTDPRSYLHVPLNFTEDDAEIRIDLPVNLQFNESTVSDIVIKKMALPGVSFSWKTAGAEPYVLVKKVHRPPAKVLFSDSKVRELVKGVPESAPLIGLERGEKIVSVDLDSESPHVLVNAGTGGGKSVILRTIAAQLIHHGAHAYILDFKRVSHQWARGVPNVQYCRDIAEIHDALERLGAEGRRRIHVAEKLGDDADPAAIGPRVVILLEEINATMKQLSKYWDSVKEKGAPKTSPAVDALAEVLFMGRAVRLHVLLVAQSATARALGGPEMRENFATRILARYTTNAWRMLVPEVAPAPKSTRHIGRAQVVLGGQAHETQIMFMSDSEAREWARAGTPEARLAAGEDALPPAVMLSKDGGAGPDDDEAAPERVEPWPAPGQASSEDPPPHAWPDPEAQSPGRTPAVPAAPVWPDPNRPSPGSPPAPRSADQRRGARPDAASRLPEATAGRATVEEPVGLSRAQRQHLPDLTLALLRKARTRDPDFPKSVGKRGSEQLYLPSELVGWARNRPGTGVAEARD